MEDSKSKRQDHYDDTIDKNINKKSLEIKNKESSSISSINNELNENKVPKINQIENNIDKGNKKIVEDKTLEENKNVILTAKSNVNFDKGDNNIVKSDKEIIKEKTPEVTKLANSETNSDKATNRSATIIGKENKEVEKKSEEIENVLAAKSNINFDKGDNNIVKSDKEIIKEKTPGDTKFANSETNSDKATNKSATLIDKENKEVEKKSEEIKNVLAAKSNANKNNPKEISTPTPVKAKTKPVKEPPIEKKPFLEFINDYLIPEIKNVFKLKGKEVNKIYLKKTHRPIAEDICWVIYCEINDTCNFWLSFEKDDITSLKSFSLCKNYEKPSIIESFLIDEKKITLKLIISRILQRLNGQKLIGAN